VPEDLLGTRLFPVQYSDAKKIHIDQLIRAFVDRNRVGELYTLALFSKPSSWADEAEIRFVWRMQAVTVVIERSLITRLILGDALAPGIRQRIEEIASALPVAARSHADVT
jgi:hypothetical protein